MLHQKMCPLPLCTLTHRLGLWAKQLVLWHWAARLGWWWCLPPLTPFLGCCLCHHLLWLHCCFFLFSLPLINPHPPPLFLPGYCLTAATTSRSSYSPELGHGMRHLLESAPAGGGRDFAAGTGLPLSLTPTAWLWHLWTGGALAGGAYPRQSELEKEAGLHLLQCLCGLPLESSGGKWDERVMVVRQ